MKKIFAFTTAAALAFGPSACSSDSAETTETSGSSEATKETGTAETAETSEASEPSAEFDAPDVSGKTCTGLLFLEARQNP